MSHLIEPYNAWQKPSRKKHWMEIAEEEHLFFKTLQESQTSQEVQTANVFAPAAGAGGSPKLQYFLPTVAKMRYSTNGGSVWFEMLDNGIYDGDVQHEAGYFLWKQKASSSNDSSLRYDITASVQCKPYISPAQFIININVDNISFIGGTLVIEITDLGYTGEISGSTGSFFEEVYSVPNSSCSITPRFYVGISNTAYQRTHILVNGPVFTSSFSTSSTFTNPFTFDTSSHSYVERITYALSQTGSMSHSIYIT